MAQYLLDVLYSLTNCFCCFPGTPQLKINNRSFRILRLLGEGGFSYVYLVQDSSGALFALKKIRCPFGQESVQRAMKEVDAYKLFDHPLIIKAVDHTIRTERDGSKTVYILLPYFRRGNLQDAINANLINHTSFPIPHLLRLFLGACDAVSQLHEHRLVSGAAEPGAGPARSSSRRNAPEDAEADDEEEAEQPLMRTEILSAREGLAEGALRPYAHRDIKPGNIMISDSGTHAILMDFGSLVATPTRITSRAEAIALQDEAAEHSTMPYRAPELFDVQTGAEVSAAVDIWSLGCTLFAALYGHSPFELETEGGGGSLALAITAAKYRFPEQGQMGGRAANEEQVPETVKEIVKVCLKVEPAERPNVGQLMEMVKKVLREMGESEEVQGDA